MAKSKQSTGEFTTTLTSGLRADQPGQPTEVFAMDNVTQLRDAVEQVVYGNVQSDKSHDPDRAHTVEVLTTLGQMGELTEMDLDEAKKDYL